MKYLLISLRDHPAPGREEPLLGDRPGLQPLRDDRRRADVGAAQQGAAAGLAGGLRGDRLLRSAAANRQTSMPGRSARLGGRRPDPGVRRLRMVLTNLGADREGEPVRGRRPEPTSSSVSRSVQPIIVLSANRWRRSDKCVNGIDGGWASGYLAAVTRGAQGRLPVRLRRLTKRAVRTTALNSLPGGSCL